jgi:hypothetical protein
MKRLSDLSLLLALLCSFAFVGQMAVLEAGCAKAPPTLGPEAARDFQKTRVIKALDLLRDFAIDGEAATPKVVSTDTTRQIVTYHQSALKILDAAGSDWKAVVGTSLDALVPALPEKDRPKVAPYVALVKGLLQEVN